MRAPARTFIGQGKGKGKRKFKEGMSVADFFGSSLGDLAVELFADCQ